MMYIYIIGKYTLKTKKMIWLGNLTPTSLRKKYKGCFLREVLLAVFGSITTINEGGQCVLAISA